MSNFSIKNNNARIRERKKKRHINLIKLKNSRIQNCINNIDINTLEYQVYDGLNDIDKKKLYLRNNPNCYKKNNPTISNKIQYVKEKINTSMYSQNRYKPIINNKEKVVNNKEKVVNNKEKVDNINTGKYKITYAEIVLQNIKYKKLNKELDKEIRMQVLINKINNFYKNRTYYNIENITINNVDNINYCIIS